MSSFISYKSQAERDVQDAIDRALEICGGMAEDHAVRRVPVKTGNLKQSISHWKVDDETEAVGTRVKYAPLVEFGHHQQPGRYVPAIKKRLKASFVAGKPFLRPAVENHQAEYTKVFQGELGKVGK